MKSKKAKTESNFKLINRNTLMAIGEGLKPGEYVTVNGSSDLSDIIRGNDNSYVENIRLISDTGVYHDELLITGRGPEGAFSGSFYTHFTDRSGDTYNKSLFSHDLETHQLRYNSPDPYIQVITWNS